MADLALLDRTALVAMEATSGISASARTVLLCLIGLLLVILGFLIAFAVLIRRRAATSPSRRPSDERVERAHRTDGRDADSGRMPATTDGLAAVAARTEGTVCPTCRRHYEAPLEYCPRDARRLVPTNRLEARAAGTVCAACRRGFDPGTRFCPHDGAELLPVALYEATRGDADPKPTGVMAKICPECRSRHDLVARFCGRDGSELVAIN